MTNQLPLRVSATQAAQLFGVSEKTIRNALKKNELHYIVVRSRYKINFDSLLAWSQKSTRRRNLRDAVGIGRHVSQWRIRNKKYSPNPNLVESARPEQTTASVTTDFESSDTAAASVKGGQPRSKTKAWKQEETVKKRNKL